MTIPAYEFPAETSTLEKIQASIIEAQKDGYKKIVNTLNFIKVVLYDNTELTDFFQSKISKGDELMVLSKRDILRHRPQNCITTLGHNQDSGRVSFTLFQPHQLDDKDHFDCSITVSRRFSRHDTWEQVVISRTSEAPEISKDDSFFPDSYWLRAMCERMQSYSEVRRVLTDYTLQHED